MYFNGTFTPHVTDRHRHAEIGECLNVPVCVGRTEPVMSQNTADRDAGQCEHVLVRTVGPLAPGILSAILQG
jgi:hypothetical protein